MAREAVAKTATKTAASVAKKSAPKASAGGAKRPLSPYNQFMKDELPKVKAAQPTLSHRDAFKAAAGNWKSSPLNPANAKAK
ncbi:hypothetical protein BC831DRAFT_402967 [Entophlyctis helioformis]|nr:hypothetical protein BC831DRAFT_402967 [Entophlyctis helioformis]